MLLNNKKTRATMKLVWEYVIVHMCSSLSEIDMLSNTQNLPANQTDYENYEKYCLNCEFSQWELSLMLVSGQLEKGHIVARAADRILKSRIKSDFTSFLDLLGKQISGKA